MNPTPPVNRSGANIRAIIVIAAAVISAGMADATLRETIGPLGVSLLSLVSVALLSWRQWLDTTSSDVRQAEHAVSTTTTTSESTSTVHQPADAETPPPASPQSHPADWTGENDA